MKKNILPPWYPASRHLTGMPFADFFALLLDFRRRLENVQVMDFYDQSIHCHADYDIASTAEKWRPFKVIDYLDLITWAHEQDIKLTGDFLAETLFPYSEANIRLRVGQVTKPLAFLLISKKGLLFFEKISSTQSVAELII